MSQIYSLTNPPPAPRKKKTEKIFEVEKIRPLVLPQSPTSRSPPGAPRKERRRRSLSPYPILHPPLENEEWDESQWDFFRDVRPKFLQYDPDYVARISDIPLLQDIHRWYNPPSCPQSMAEFVYLKSVSQAAEARLKFLGADMY